MKILKESKGEKADGERKPSWIMLTREQEHLLQIIWARDMTVLCGPENFTFSFRETRAPRLQIDKQQAKGCWRAGRNKAAAEIHYLTELYA